MTDAYTLLRERLEHAEERIERLEAQIHILIERLENHQTLDRMTHELPHEFTRPKGERWP